MNHIRYMKRALELADKGLIHVSPNPAVGAVLVKNGRIIGEGYHKGPGTPHAEIAAIESASEPVKDATLYTTLEPCVTMYPGKSQPPCTDRIISEEIRKVIISLIDPNKHVNGQGILKLLDTGISVKKGVLEKETAVQNEVYIKNMVTDLPFVHLKIAQTLDGRIATGEKDSKWITDGDAKDDVHNLRSLYDSILIGSGTARIDNPLLTVRNESYKKITRIVLDSKLSLHPTLKLFDETNNDKTLIVTGSDISAAREKLFSSKNTTVIRTQLNENKQIALLPLLKSLFNCGIRSILVEGGSDIFTSFVREKLFDKITVYTAPVICGSGTQSINDLGTKLMGDSINLKNVSLKTINKQFVMTGYREESCLQV